MQQAWDYAQHGGRAGAGRVIVEGFIRFDYEITLLTVRHAGGTSFCAPIGHLQVDGDYRESWQPQPMSAVALAESRAHRARRDGCARRRRHLRRRAFRQGRRSVVQRGVAAAARHRPRDAGFAGPERVRAARARNPRAAGPRDSPARSVGFLRDPARRRVTGHPLPFASRARSTEPDTQLRLFGKPEVRGRRRMGVALATRCGPRRGPRQGAPRGGGDREGSRAALKPARPARCPGRLDGRPVSGRPAGAPRPARGSCPLRAKCR